MTGEYKGARDHAGLVEVNGGEYARKIVVMLLPDFGE